MLTYWLYTIILQINILVPAGQEYITRLGEVPRCPENYFFPTVKTALETLYLKRSTIQQTDRNGNEQFSPQVHLPWTCNLETFWKDLGENHFPRFVKDGVCTSSACWYGHYFCRPVTYKMNVLYGQYENKCIDRNLPRTLAFDWRLGEINITVACVCSRN